MIAPVPARHRGASSFTLRDHAFLALLSGRGERRLCEKDEKEQADYFKRLWILADLACDMRDELDLEDISNGG